MSSRQVLLNCFHLIRALINLFHLLKVFLNSSQLFCTPESSDCQREVSCTKNNWAQKPFVHISLRNRCIYTEKALQNTLNYKACTKHLPVLCTTLYYKTCTQYSPVLLSHATFTQPLQYVLQHHVANLNLSTHMATPDDNNHAATPLRTHIDTTTCCRTQRRNPSGTTPAATAAHTRYLSFPAAATLHGKMQGFVLRLPPQNKAHATFMQPLQYVSQHHVAHLHLATHMATPDGNNHAATPMRSATTDSRNAKNYAHRHNHSLQNTEEEPITSGTTPAATAAHTSVYVSLPPCGCGGGVG